MELGQKITVHSQYKRFGQYRRDQTIDAYRDVEFKEWVEYPLAAPIEVIVVGVRTLSNGFNRYLSEYGNVFHPQTFFKALLVVKDLKTKPFFVPNNI